MIKPKPLLLGALAIVAAGGLYLWYAEIERERQNNAAQLRQALTDLDALREENARLAQSQTNTAEIARQRAERAELLRLRDEVTQLRRQVQEQQAAARRLASAQPTPSNEPPPVPPTIHYATTNRAIVGWSQSLVTGGWQSAPGKRVLFFLQPELDPASGHIVIQSRIIEVPETALAQAGLQGIQTEDRTSAPQAVLSSEQAQAVLKTFEATSGVNVLSAPRVVTADGQSAQVKIGSVQNLPGGKYETGPQLDIVPRISADRNSVDLSVGTQLRVPWESP